jgi:hypothetical protein
MSDYKTDLNELQKHKENIALEQYDDLVNKCTLSPVPFLKKNYEFKILRERRTEPNITTFLGVTWLKICMLCGIKQNQSTEVWQDITNLVFSYYSDLTIEEIFKAFELERFGEFPERTEHYQFFNSEYVSAVLKKYRVWKQTTKIQHNIFKSESVALLPDISESQKKETINKGIIRVFNHFKEFKIIDNPFIHIFDELFERGLIKGANTPLLEKYYFNKQVEAKKVVQKELEIEKSNSNFIQRKNIQREIEQVIIGKSNKIIIETKRIVLKEYFEKLISENIEIENLLKK